LLVQEVSTAFAVELFRITDKSVSALMPDGFMTLTVYVSVTSAGSTALVRRDKPVKEQDEGIRIALAYSTDEAQDHAPCGVFPVVLQPPQKYVEPEASVEAPPPPPMIASAASGLPRFV
jgi:hypothetical protein